MARSTARSQPVLAYLEAMCTCPPSFESSMHLLADPMIDLDAGADTAHLDT
jgi:hypothetical protein